MSPTLKQRALGVFLLVFGVFWTLGLISALQYKEDHVFLSGMLAVICFSEAYKRLRRSKRA